MRTSLLLIAVTLGFVAVPLAGGRQQSSDAKKPISSEAPDVGASPAILYDDVLSSGALSIPINDNSSVTHTLDGTALYGVIDDVTVGVRLNHAHDGDLRIIVTAPNGTTVPLALNNGGTGDNFGSDTGSTYYTYFDDDAPRRLESGAPPYDDFFRPVRPLSILAGSPARGTWRLTIVDEGTGDTGTLLGWFVRPTFGHAAGHMTGTERPDLAVWRPSTGTWFIKAITENVNVTAVLGQPGDIPVPEFYIHAVNGNQHGVFRPSTGEWIVPGQPSVVWGINGDVPVPGNYRGFNTSDIAVWRPSDGNWYIKDYATVQFGAAGDIPVPADWSGGTGTNLGVWRPSTGQWLTYSDFGNVVWGGAGDIPVPADYIGSHYADYAVFRPSNGTWYIRDKLGNTRIVQYGINGDIPVPADYDGDGKADVAVFRPSEGRFYIKDFVSVQFGAAGDVPVVKRPTYPGYPY
jgi:subtilisin-like proprotein convertase family protein